MALADKKPNKEVARLNGIESLRALAARMVVIYHMVLLPNPNIVLPAYLGFVKDKFGLGVPLFYALSGFVLAYGYADKLDNRQAIIKFYIRRFFRIAPLFYSLLLVAALIRLKLGAGLPNWHDLVLNFLMLFGLVPGLHESMVWAGWSIGVEILFYLGFPIFAAVVIGVPSAVLMFLTSVLVGSSYFSTASDLQVGSYAYMNIVTHLPHFMAGICSFFIWRACEFRERKFLGLSLLLISTIGAAILVYYPSSQNFLSIAKGVRLDLYVWSVIFAALILSVLFWPHLIATNRVSTYLGKISFSLYLWHPPIVIAMFDLYKYFSKNLGAGGVNFIACSAATLVVVVSVSVISYRLIEMPGMAYGKRVSA